MARSNVKETFVGIAACLLVLAVVVGWMVLKMEMYGGDPACLVIKCVKVIH